MIHLALCIRSADPEEVKLRCPVCCGSCDCKTCHSAQSKIGAVKVDYELFFWVYSFYHFVINIELGVDESTYKLLQEILKEKFKRSKFQHLQYLINFLLPVLVQINQEQSIEVEKEAKFKGMVDHEC